MGSMHEILHTICSSSEENVLATIIHVEGSSYRKEGTTQLFNEKQSIVGLLSPGCFEADIKSRIPGILEQRRSQTLVFDLSGDDDLLWGLGTGCNGVVTVLLEPVDDCFRHHLCQLNNFLNQGHQVTMIRKLTFDDSVSDYLFITDHFEVFGEWQSERPPFINQLNETVHQSFEESGKIYCSEIFSTIYVQSFKPKPRLVIFGAGADVVPIVKLASMVGFSVTVTDWRPTYCTKEHFPTADELITGFPEETIKNINFTKNDSVLLVTHHFLRDMEILNQLRDQCFLYLGVLGSNNRTKRLLKNMPHQEISSPVGIAIGAEGPEEIAISIVAELIQKQRMRPNDHRSYVYGGE